MTNIAVQPKLEEKAPEAKPPRPNVKFHPANDQVLVKMDIKKRSKLDIHGDGRPMVLPSGVIVEVGKGVFVPGVGWEPSQFKEGEHVAISMDLGPWVQLPLSENPEEIFVTVSETQILGHLEGAEPSSPWFDSMEDTAPVVGRVAKAPPRGRR